MKEGDSNIPPRTLQLNLKPVCGGRTEGIVIKSELPISFLGDVDPASGKVQDPNNPLFKQSIEGKVLVFPEGRGSTVGSYVLYQLMVNGKAPAAIVTMHSEPVVVVGAIISHIPYLDGLSRDEFRALRNDMWASIDADIGIMLVKM